MPTHKVNSIIVPKHTQTNFSRLEKNFYIKVAYCNPRAHNQLNQLKEKGNICSIIGCG